MRRNRKTLSCSVKNRLYGRSQIGRMPMRWEKQTAYTLGLAGMLAAFCLHPGCHPRPVLSIRLPAQTLSPAPACVPGTLGDWSEKTPFEPAVIEQLQNYTRRELQKTYLPRYNCRSCPVQVGPCRIQITLAVLPPPPGPSPQTQPCRMEITFNIIDPASNSPSHSKTLLRDCPRCDTDTLVSTGKSIIHEYLEKLYPQIQMMDCPLAVGQGEWDHKGREFVQKGDFQAALNAFRQAVDVNPSSAPSLYNAGLLCEYLGDTASAKQYYQRAWRVSPAPEYRQGLQRVLTR